MTDRQLTFRGNEIIQILNRVYLSFKDGLFQESAKLLEQALAIDFEYEGVAAALKCTNFWLEREEKLRSIGNAYERGEYLLAQWRLFAAFIGRIGDVSERCVYNLKHYVFQEALNSYLTLYNESDVNDADILLRIGRCHKGKGNYENAIEFFEAAGRQRHDDPVILSELADCYSLINEAKAAKVFFREAFFLDPQAVELPFLESPMIQRLVKRLREMGFEEPELKEWVPVYGVIFGLFNIKRELKPLELGKLKQSIYTLEKDVEGGKKHLAPRLINRYFWLIDHYISTHEDRSKIEEILRQIKTLDPLIYKEYTN